MLKLYVSKISPSQKQQQQQQQQQSLDIMKLWSSDTEAAEKWITWARSISFSITKLVHP